MVRLFLALPRGKRLKACMARIVPNYSAFRKRNNPACLPSRDWETKGIRKIKKRGRPRIRTAEYWREYYTRKQREWRAAHLRIRTTRTQKQRRANDRRAASR